MKIEFVCEKDPLLASYFSQWAPGGTTPSRENPCWKDLLEKELTNKVLELVRRGDDPNNWKARMLAEARLQEWYDFTIDGRGRRTPILDENGDPIYLIPKVCIAL